MLNVVIYFSEKDLLVYAQNTERPNFDWSFISAWNVGKAGCPPKAKEIVPYEKKKDENVGELCGGAIAGFCVRISENKMTQATEVAATAPTAIGL